MPASLGAETVGKREETGDQPKTEEADENEGSEKTLDDIIDRYAA